ncbi:hypothetical protein ACHAXA_008544 [Cyclostephanos tholiformis]|uniref:4-hydroxyphenylpyruvate dioxygenase n=1 Tax=Cyclostephanos tholiformis TaxID=382380 RepID=A0ABD3RA43_9STRA
MLSFSIARRSSSAASSSSSPPPPHASSWPSSLPAKTMMLTMALLSTTTTTTAILPLLLSTPRPTSGLLFHRHRHHVVDRAVTTRPLAPLPERWSSSTIVLSSASSSPIHSNIDDDSPRRVWKPTFPSPVDRESHFRTERLRRGSSRRRRGRRRDRASEDEGEVDDVDDDGGGDRLGTIDFHHVEFYVGDASTTARRFEVALGMPITCHSSLSTGNDVCVTYGLECRGSGGGGEDGGWEEDEEGGVYDGVRFLITAPLGRKSTTSASSSTSNANGDIMTNDVGPAGTAPLPMPGYDPEYAREFVSRHGMAVRALGIRVVDAIAAYDGAVTNGARGVLPPTIVRDFNEGSDGGETCRIAEVGLYGDVVLRFVSFHSNKEDDDDDRKPPRRRGSSRRTSPSSFLPNLSPYPNNNDNNGGKTNGRRYNSRPRTYGLSRIDHAVGNVPNLLEALEYISNFTGYHLFAEFASEDVGTLDSGLNSVVLASYDDTVLLPLNEPTEGRRKSQIQTFLEQNDGPGLQHIAIKSNDIFETIAHMRMAEEELGGFELMARPSNAYYRDLPSILGDRLTSDQYELCEELGILADVDDEGVLLQIFTKPLGDRPTLFLEIIQRIGCVLTEDDHNDNDATDRKEMGEEEGGSEGIGVRRARKMRERPGCGGFGVGNFRELFKSIEDFEKTLKV